MARIPTDQIARIRDSQRDVMKMRLVELEVTEYWRVIFSPRGIETLAKQDMTGFLSYRQNKRWREISKDDVTADMEALKESLRILTDGSVPVAERLNRLEPGHGAAAIPFLGKAKLTPILLVTAPDRYGVWNDYSERALRGMELMPDLSATHRLGDQYEQVNEVLVRLAATYRISLWRLDIILEQIARLVRP